MCVFVCVLSVKTNVQLIQPVFLIRDEGMQNEKSNLLLESRSEPKNHLIQDLGGELTEKATFDDSPEDDEYILSWKPIAVITAALAVLSFFGLWYRKLQYDRKGIHKRRDSL